ncbi:MAG: prepilin-type N-terminal cleavage/methylation domain-containing protein [Candidatus Rokuibacteriota bacterium]
MQTLSRVRADRRGFTLAELLVAIAILGLVMLGVLTLLMTGNQSYLTGSNQAEAQAAARAALERITLDIREAGYGPLSDQNCTPPAAPPANAFNAVIFPGAANPPTSFTLQADWDGSGAVNCLTNAAVVVTVNYKFWNGVAYVDTAVSRGEQVTYSVVGGNLQRQESAVDAAPQILVTGVQQAATGPVCGGAVVNNPPIFQYCDANGNNIVNPAAVPEQIRLIVVNMRVGVQNQPPAIWRAGAVQVTMSDRIRLRNRI